MSLKNEKFHAGKMNESIVRVMFDKFPTVESAQNVAGTLSAPNKMPCPAISLPAYACKTGVKLQAVENSVCSNCYAMKGRYVMPNVKDALQRRLDGLANPDWKYALLRLIISEVKQNIPFFRFHDSGDIQSEKHFADIIWIAAQLPHVNFWIPTKEKKFANREVPANVVIRYSAAMINSNAGIGFANNSSVVVKRAIDAKLFNATACIAPEQKGKCLDCRACWNRDVKTIAYIEH